ncbi:MAG: HupE/UreJ family protein [Steroidobacteraceae bacterium]
MIAGRWRHTIRAGCILLATGATLLASVAASAHANGASYLRIEAEGDTNRILATWDIAASDLELPLELDDDGDGKYSAAEFELGRTAISQFATQRLRIARGGADCPLSTGAVATRMREEPYFTLRLTARCPSSGTLHVSSSLFFGSAGYSTLLDVQTSGGRFPAMLSATAPNWVEPPAPDTLDTVMLFAREGVWHVLIGYDHIAFLCLLLLPSVLRGSSAGWTVVTRLRDGIGDVIGIVTVFTVAHSITLGLAVTGVVQIPVQPIEVAIAGSIVVAGVINLFPAVSRWRLGLAFGFGLIHGFGFANALQESGGGGGFRLAPMLGGFNLGVEVGQLLIVAAILPILWILGRSPRYASRIMPALSLATAVTGAIWFAGRL